MLVFIFLIRNLTCHVQDEKKNPQKLCTMFNWHRHIKTVHMESNDGTLFRYQHLIWKQVGEETQNSITSRCTIYAIEIVYTSRLKGSWVVGNTILLVHLMKLWKPLYIQFPGKVKQEQKRTETKEVRSTTD